MHDPSQDPLREDSPAAEAGAPDETLATPADASSTEPADAEEAASHADALSPAVDKRRLEEQLEALKRRELELRRAIAVADHPELADAIRLLEGRLYSLTRAEAKLSQGLSKSEERRKETLEKKVAALCEKRAELDAQIGELEGELHGLTLARTASLEKERDQALEALVATLGEHAGALSAKGLDVAVLVPEIGERMPQIRATAERLADAQNTARSQNETKASED